MGSAFWNKQRDDCERIEPRLEEFTSGTMPDSEEKVRIAGHLTHCSHCRTQAEAYQRAGQAWTAFATRETPERPGDWAAVRSRLHTVPRREERPRLPLFGGRALLGMAMAATMGVLAVLLPSPWRIAYTADDAALTEQVSGDSARQPPVSGGGYGGTTRSHPNAIITPTSRQENFRVAPTGGKGDDFMVAPAFALMETHETYPLVVVIKNAGDAANAELTVRPMSGGPRDRVYVKKARIEARGKTQIFLYPSMGPSSVYGDTAFQVTLTLNGKKRTATLPISNSIPNEELVGYIGKGFGALSRKLTMEDKPVSTSASRIYPPSPNIFACCATPENAPDRAQGYDGLDALVVSEDGVALTPVQWKAIQEWTQSGGKLILIGGMDNPLLSNPQAAELAPVIRASKNAFNLSVTPKSGAWEEQLNSYLLNSLNLPARSGVIKRPLGVGIVTYTNFDPTDEALRETAEYISLWNHLIVPMDKPMDGQGLREAARQRSLWTNDVPQTVSDNPFLLALPSLNSVLSFFLIYFVLAVPVTFAVLKHTRRMNLAWVTGPTLAIVFAAGLFLLTARLYFMPTARRTAGIVTMNADGAGRFVGFTEMFFPRAGGYPIVIPGAQTLETERRESDITRSLQTAETADGVLTAPALSVGNLAFRRLYHEQELTLPGGVTVQLNTDAHGSVTASVNNQTGKTLNNAIVTRLITTHPDLAHPTWNSTQVKIVALGTIDPGFSKRVLPQSAVTETSDRFSWPRYFNQYFGYSGAEMRDVHGYPSVPMPTRPTFMANLSGQSFGPQIGKDFSDARSVTVIVGLDEKMLGGDK